MKSYTKGLIIIAFIACGINTKAQIGINNSDPDSSAILDIQHEKKGVLFPRIANSSTVGMVKGMFFYATDDNKFYYFNGSSWQCVNPFNSTGKDNARLNGDLTVQGGDLTVETPNTINGYGTIPIGGIIMWSGSTALFDGTGMGIAGTTMDGWALCNNQNGRPDLRGRFVVGYDPSVTEYNSLEKTGGVKQNSLTVSNIPKHIHDAGSLTSVSAGSHSHLFYGFKKTYNGTGGERQAKSRGKIDTDPADYGGEPAGAHTHDVSGNTGSWGTTTVTAVPNRPPYLVVAYIIRVK